MRRPNGSGSVIKLSGKRRRPYAVRIFDGYKENANGQMTPTYKYISYHEKQADALVALERYNIAPVELVKEKESSKKHTFRQIYDMWCDELNRRSKQLSEQTWYSYRAAFNNLASLHSAVFENLTLEDLESAALVHSSKSLSTITNIKVVLRGMYKCALRHRYVTEDISRLMILESENKNARPHTIFTDEEIATLWEHKEDFYAKLLLILIYTGLRIRELLSIRTENVYLDKRYMVGGIKTDAGKNRNIPLSDKIIPLLNTQGKYLIMLDGKKLPYYKASDGMSAYLKSLNMVHTFHDTRHTAATLLEQAKVPELHRKLILGHSTNDITDRYTHVSIEQLITDINRI